MEFIFSGFLSAPPVGEAAPERYDLTPRAEVRDPSPEVAEESQALTPFVAPAPQLWREACEAARAAKESHAEVKALRSQLAVAERQVQVSRADAANAVMAKKQAENQAAMVLAASVAATASLGSMVDMMDAAETRQCWVRLLN